MELEPSYRNLSKLAFDDVSDTTRIDLTDPTRRTAMEAYFAGCGLNAAQSFVSLVLVRLEPDSGVLEPVGVLNINSKTAGVFSSQFKQRVLLHTLRPLIPHLAQIAAWFKLSLEET